jgi:translation initiation factor IF-2
MKPNRIQIQSNALKAPRKRQPIAASAFCERRLIVSKTTISSLRRFKDDVAEVTSGLECGVLLADTNDIKPGDSLEVFEVEERARTL